MTRKICFWLLFLFAGFIAGTRAHAQCTLVSAGPLEYVVSKQCVVVECAKDVHNTCQKLYKNAREGQAYVAYIVNNYNDLNGTYIFVRSFEKRTKISLVLKYIFLKKVHGHSKSWHQHQDIFDAIERARFTEGFVGLNKLPIRIEHPENTIFGTIWNAVLSPVIDRPMPKRICVDGSAQFAVHASRIKRYPIEVWNELYAYVYGTKTWPGSDTWSAKTSRKLFYRPGDFLGSGWFTEYIFGVLLGDRDCI